MEVKEAWISSLSSYSHHLKLQAWKGLGGGSDNAAGLPEHESVASAHPWELLSSNPTSDTGVCPSSVSLSRFL